MILFVDFERVDVSILIRDHVFVHIFSFLLRPDRVTILGLNSTYMYMLTKNVKTVNSYT